MKKEKIKLKKFGLYSDSESSPVMDAFAKGVRNIGGQPQHRNSNPFDLNDKEDFDVVVVEKGFGGSKLVPSAYEGKIPVIVVSPGLIRQDLGYKKISLGSPYAFVSGVFDGERVKKLAIPAPSRLPAGVAIRSALVIGQDPKSTVDNVEAAELSSWLSETIQSFLQKVPTAEVVFQDLSGALDVSGYTKKITETEVSVSDYDVVITYDSGYGLLALAEGKLVLAHSSAPYFRYTESYSGESGTEDLETFIKKASYHQYTLEEIETGSPIDDLLIGKIGFVYESPVLEEPAVIPEPLVEGDPAVIPAPIEEQTETPVIPEEPKKKKAK